MAWRHLPAVAISARRGEPGLIPGSMGTASYVVAGLGNPVSLMSAPHGAGRVFSRSKARRTFTVEQLREAMQGIEYEDSAAFIDEIPAAYKDVADVVEVVQQAGLGRKVARLKPLAVIKG